MIAPVNLNRTEKLDPTERARQAWGEPPEWVLRLAGEAARTSGASVARRLGYSGGLVSQVIGNKYPGDLDKIEAAVRGAFMGETVVCPILDEIGRDRCLREQAMPRSAASATRSRLYHACRAGCPHSRLKGIDDDAA